MAVGRRNSTSSSSSSSYGYSSIVRLIVCAPPLTRRLPRVSFVFFHVRTVFVFNRFFFALSQTPSRSSVRIRTRSFRTSRTSVGRSHESPSCAPVGRVVQALFRSWVRGSGETTLMDTILRYDAETTERRDTVARRLGFRERLRRQSVLHRSQHQEDHLDRPQRQVNKHVNIAGPPFPDPSAPLIRTLFVHSDDKIPVPDVHRRLFCDDGGWVGKFFLLF